MAIKLEGRGGGGQGLNVVATLSSFTQFLLYTTRQPEQISTMHFMVVFKDYLAKCS